MKFTKITSVEVLGHYRMRLGFSDGIYRDVDLAGELRGPVFEPLADPEFFAQVRVDDELGTVVWPNGADLDPLVLHGARRERLASRESEFSELCCSP